jgi:hypothetical protein
MTRIECKRCARELHRADQDADRWNTEYQRGRQVGFICPDCQTDVEDLEAEVNLATTDYTSMRRDAFGLWRARPKVTD